LGDANFHRAHNHGGAGAQILGLFAFGSGVAIVVHLTNAFLLAVIVTYLISFADSADKTSTTVALQTKASPSGKMPA